MPKSIAIGSSNRRPAWFEEPGTLAKHSKSRVSPPRSTLGPVAASPQLTSMLRGKRSPDVRHLDPLRLYNDLS